MNRDELLWGSSVPLEPDTLLPRGQVAQALTEHGFPTAASTLATYAVRGGGPEFFKWGQRAMYRWGTTLSWAQGKLRKAGVTHPGATRWCGHCGPGRKAAERWRVDPAPVHRLLTEDPACDGDRVA